jgi:hypothetical protein
MRGRGIQWCATSRRPMHDHEKSGMASCETRARRRLEPRNCGVFLTKDRPHRVSVQRWVRLSAPRS